MALVLSTTTALKMPPKKAQASSQASMALAVVSRSTG
jgi:hypothetical protein